MQVISFGTKLNSKIVLCLGYFGCMHLGHVALLDKAKQLAADNNCRVALFTFENDVLDLQGKQGSAIFTFEERLKIYQNLGVDIVIKAKFDNAFRQTKGLEFLQQVAQYKLAAIVCGYDYTCGCDRIDSKQVQLYYSPLIDVTIINAVKYLNQKLSTSLVCSYLTDNKIERVNALLSQPFFLSGVVVKGRKVGSQMGFPTANIDVPSSKLLPIGVYAGECSVDGQIYKCIVNIGSKPTFDISVPTVEVHLINYSGDLYGRCLAVSINRFIRNIERFEDVHQLVEQLQKDREEAIYD